MAFISPQFSSLSKLSRNIFSCLTPAACVMIAHKKVNHDELLYWLQIDSLLYTRRPETDKSGMCRHDICWGQTNISSHWQWISWSSLHCRRCCYLDQEEESLHCDMTKEKKSSSIPIKASLGVDEDIITLTMAIITMNERILKGRMMWQCSREPTVSTRLLKVIISELWWFRKGHQLRFPLFCLILGEVHFRLIYLH